MATTPVRNPIKVLERITGNREPIAAQLLDMDGAAINLTGRTVVFRMVLIADGTVKINNAAATLDTASTGKVSYTPSASDVNTAGRYACYFLDTTDTPNKLWPYDGARFQLNIKAETSVQ